MAKEALLDLDTLLDREHINIDHQAYELRRPGELSIFDGATAARIGEQLNNLGGKPMSALSKDEAAQIQGALETLIAMILIAPDDVRARLTSHQCLAIGQAFFAQPQPTTGTRRAAARRPIPSTGGRSSRGSSASTARRRRTG
jgi:hypothetical protein